MTEEAEDLLPEADAAFLAEKAPKAVVHRVGDEVHVRIPAFQFPGGYQPRTADLLIRLPAGYPDAGPDMFWTMPDVRLLSGAWPQAAEHHEVPGSGKGAETYAGVPWQRWSRHMQGWRAGVDGLRSFVAAIANELNRKV